MCTRQPLSSVLDPQRRRPSFSSTGLFLIGPAMSSGKRLDGGGAPIASLEHLVKRPRDSLLTVTLPFREEAKPRTINVEVAA